jgi:rubrerythrin
MSAERAWLPLLPTGRWGGKATKQALPRDPTVDELNREQRERLAAIWLSQAATELRVASSFAIVHKALVALAAEKSLIALAERAIDDEHRHAVLCRDVAERYLGEEPVEPPTLPFAFPQHTTASSEQERQALFIIGQCAFNETFASAYLSASLELATTSLARAAIRELLSDEVDHARLGWAYLQTLPKSLQRGIQGWILPLAVCNLREWRSIEYPITEEEESRFAPFGIPSKPVIERALLSALHGMILPGLARFGYDTAQLQTWLAQGAPT